MDSRQGLPSNCCWGWEPRSVAGCAAQRQLPAPPQGVPWVDTFCSLLRSFLGPPGRPRFLLLPWPSLSSPAGWRLWPPECEACLCVERPFTLPPLPKLLPSPPAAACAGLGLPTGGLSRWRARRPPPDASGCCFCLWWGWDGRPGRCSGHWHSQSPCMVAGRVLQLRSSSACATEILLACAAGRHELRACGAALRAAVRQNSGAASACAACPRRRSTA